MSGERRLVSHRLNVEGTHMSIVRKQTIVPRDGEIRLEGLPYVKGQRVEVLVTESSPASTVPAFSAKDLMASGLVGLWKDRKDIEDSVSYARELRERAMRRRG